MKTILLRVNFTQMDYIYNENDLKDERTNDVQNNTRFALKETTEKGKIRKYVR